jgi:hypothetical protein
MKIGARVGSLVVLAGLIGAACMSMRGAETGGDTSRGFDGAIGENARRLMDDGRAAFRHDTFGSEGFWGGALQLHQGIAGQKHGGVGAGVSPKQALAAGLKVESRRSHRPSWRPSRRGKLTWTTPAARSPSSRPMRWWA